MGGRGLGSRAARLVLPGVSPARRRLARYGRWWQLRVRPSASVRAGTPARLFCFRFCFWEGACARPAAPRPAWHTGKCSSNARLGHPGWTASAAHLRVSAAGCAAALPRFGLKRGSVAAVKCSGDLGSFNTPHGISQPSRLTVPRPLGATAERSFCFHRFHCPLSDFSLSAHAPMYVCQGPLLTSLVFRGRGEAGARCVSGAGLAPPR